MAISSPLSQPTQADPFFGPPQDCSQCPRLAAFRNDNRADHPDWFNAPVPSFGDPTAQLLIVGLAPGLQGANKTGRPFTGDFAGDFLYAALLKHGFAKGVYDKRPDDTLELKNTVISNAVRCVPPQNKPTPAEITQCRPYLSGLIDALPNLKILLCLGRISHDSTLMVLGQKLADHPFSHGACHTVRESGLVIADSYHCSRYNTNTGRLTESMFDDVLLAIKDRLRAAT